MACFNPILAERRRRKREELLVATEAKFARIAAEVNRRTKTPLTKAEIGVKAGKVLNKHQVGNHFALEIEDGHPCRFSEEIRASTSTQVIPLHIGALQLLQKECSQ